MSESAKTVAIETSAEPTKTEKTIKEGSWVRVVHSGSFHGFVSFVVTCVSGHFIISDANGILWKRSDLVLIDEPEKKICVGDYVHPAARLTGVSQVVEIVTTTTYRVKTPDGKTILCNRVLPLSNEEESAFVDKRCKELTKIATEALQESIALKLNLSEKAAASTARTESK